MSIHPFEMMDAVCAVKIFGRNGLKGSGVGTFISPYHVLTCAHVLSDLDRAFAMNSLREEAEIIITDEYKSQDSDLHIARLSYPIGHHFLSPRLYDLSREQIKSGYLLSRFNDRAEAHRVSVDYDHNHHVNHKDLDHLIVMRSSNLVVPGYSGSPIIDNAGKIIGLVSAIVPNEQSNAVIIYEYAVNQLGISIPPAIPFLATRPEKLAEFMRHETFPRNPAPQRPYRVFDI